MKNHFILFLKDNLLLSASNVFFHLNRRKRLLILAIHRIKKNSSINCNKLKQQFSYLLKNYELVSPSTFSPCQWYKPKALLTIDDCHSDTYEKIFPIAYDLGVPFTICMPTDFFFRNKWLWFDRLMWGLKKAGAGKTITLGNHDYFTGTKSFEFFISDYLKSLTPEIRETEISLIFELLNINAPDHPVSPYLSVKMNEMRHMLKTGLVEICNHTVTHPILTKIPKKEAFYEMTESRHEIELFWGKPVISFCYPGGKNNFNTTTRQILIDEKYKMAFTSLEGNNYFPGIDMLSLKRIHVHKRYSVFLKLASGIADIQRKIKI